MENFGMNDTFEKPTCFLVVDDFESMRKLVIKNLDSMGYTQIVQASNGKEALHLLEINPRINVVITDWNMPVMPGIELLREIRSRENLKHLPVLMITAEAGRHQVTEAAEAGVSDFLVKPFTVGGLQNKLNKMLRNLRRGVVAGLKVAMQEAAAQRENPVETTPTSNPRHAPVPATPALGFASAARPSASDGKETPALVLSRDAAARLASRPTVLLVDDVTDNIEVLAGLLQEDYRVQAAKSGPIALKMIETSSHIPDLILLDVMMPGMDGFEVCRRLKASPRSADIPVLFLSAADDTLNVVQGFELGAVDYVAKPADPTILKARVRHHIASSRAFVALQKQNQILEENIRLHEDVERITAHDMKNPIGGIINFTSMLIDDDMMTNDQRQMLETVSDSAHTLLNMVNLSLDLFKIEQGHYDLQPSRVNLALIIRKILVEKKPEIFAKKLEVTHDIATGDGSTVEEMDFFVNGDELLCYSLFGNLIKNAVEASPVDGAMNIRCRSGAEGWATVMITNNGVPPAEIRAHFFAKYATAGKRGGTGLGTYSAKLLTEVQHGSIDMAADDAANETTLTIKLPTAN